MRAKPIEFRKGKDKGFLGPGSSERGLRNIGVKERCLQFWQGKVSRALAVLLSFGKSIASGGMHW
jgi:hypothetical protein